MKIAFGWALVGLGLCGCAAPLHAPPTVRTAPQAGGSPDRSVEALAASIMAEAARSDHEPSATVRAALARQATADAQTCMARQPRAAPCLYGSALALGLEARVHPTQAGTLLTAMLDKLTTAESVDPTYDEAGPARVRALVLLRAPSWPLGPGDTDAGLLAARSAVATRPQYPPNSLALAEALAKTGDLPASREAYEHARALAQALPQSTERDDWLRQAAEALRRST